MQLETRRLLLRPISIEDLDEFVALHADPEVTALRTPRSTVRKPRSGCGATSANGASAATACSPCWTGRAAAFLGRAGLKHWPQFDETEVGWVLRRDAWGHGYATEAARACIEWGVLGAARCPT